MTEIAPPNPYTAPMEVPRQRDTERRPEAEHMSETHMVVDMFIDDLAGSVERKTAALELAVKIDAILSPGDITPAPPAYREKLLRILQAADASGDDVFDHKLEQDEVFATLVRTLQSPQTQLRSLRDSRKAARKLTEVRALLPDETASDASWHAIIDRLFS